MFIFALIVVVVGVIALIVALRANEVPKSVKKVFTTAAAAVLGLGLVLTASQSFYTQDAGEANVIKDITGNITGQNNDTGLQFKAPWETTVLYSIRNQQVVFAGETGQTTDHNGGTVNGAQITAQDADGVSSNIDIALRYSIKPGAVTDIYKEFQSEENFKKSFIEQDVRSVVRLVPNKFSTIELLTDRDKVEAAILKALESRWEDDGVVIDSISLQEIRPPATVVEAYAAAQEAQINVSKETANLEAQTVKAQQKVVKSQADADANKLLSDSLTDKILQQNYLDTLKELAAGGNLVVVPEGFNGLVNVSK